MKMADVLHSIADMLEKHASNDSTSNSRADIFQHDDNSGNQDAELSNVMIPPLQQKLEILKKTAGMDNAFDSHGDADELADIKKLTGVKAVIGHLASEDNDVVG